MLWEKKLNLQCDHFINNTRAFEYVVLQSTLILCTFCHNWHSQLALWPIQCQQCSPNTAYHLLGLAPTSGPHPGEEDVAWDGCSGGSRGSRQTTQSTVAFERRRLTGGSDVTRGNTTTIRMIGRGSEQLTNQTNKRGARRDGTGRSHDEVGGGRHQAKRQPTT
jgi:hypothetical protein